MAGPYEFRDKLPRVDEHHVRPIYEALGVDPTKPPSISRFGSNPYSEGTWDFTVGVMVKVGRVTPKLTEAIERSAKEMYGQDAAEFRRLHGFGAYVVVEALWNASGEGFFARLEKLQANRYIPIAEMMKAYKPCSTTGDVYDFGQRPVEFPARQATLQKVVDTVAPLAARTGIQIDLPIFKGDIHKVRTAAIGFYVGFAKMFCLPWAPQEERDPILAEIIPAPAEAVVPEEFATFLSTL